MSIWADRSRVPGAHSVCVAIGSELPILLSGYVRVAALFLYQEGHGALDIVWKHLRREAIRLDCKEGHFPYPMFTKLC